MKILEHLFQLPPTINYVGFTFSLQIRKDRFDNFFLGYYLTGHHSKKKYKKQAFQLGIWSERERVVVSSVESDYLFKVLILDELRAIGTLANLLKNNGVPVREFEENTIETEFSEIINNNFLLTTTT